MAVNARPTYSSIDQTQSYVNLYYLGLSAVVTAVVRLSFYLPVRTYEVHTLQQLQEAVQQYPGRSVSAALEPRR